MSARRAASSMRSMVNHQAAKGVRSRRETIETPPGYRSDQSCLPLVDGGLTAASVPAGNRKVRSRPDDLGGHCPSVKTQLQRPLFPKSPILVSIVHVIDFAKIPQ